MHAVHAHHSSGLTTSFTLRKYNIKQRKFFAEEIKRSIQNLSLAEYLTQDDVSITNIKLVAE
jgi:hypothetical protein